MLSQHRIGAAFAEAAEASRTLSAAIEEARRLSEVEVLDLLGEAWRATMVANLEDILDRLDSLGDDAQLANIDLQNILQKQQQTLQMMSNISKMLYDTAMAVVRKIGG